MTPRRPVLRYFGGKWLLAPWVISFFPTHRTYVEAFGGAASVLMRKDPARIEVYNDMDGEIVNVFRVLRNQNQSLRLNQQLINTPYSREEYFAAFEPTDDCLERARRTIVKAFFGHGSDSVTNNKKSGFRGRNSNSNRHAALDWINYAPQIQAFSERLAGVTIEQMDAVDLMPLFDSPDTLFYLDPPYCPETRGTKHNYRHEYDTDSHNRLIEFIPSLKGMVVLSGYENETYDKLGWRKVTTTALADGAKERTEVLWLNPAVEARQEQMELVL